MIRNLFYIYNYSKLSKTMASIFTKIINGEIPCYKVAETDEFLAFLDINPNAKGHTLCIPKKEVDKIFDLDETSYNGLMSFSRRVALAIEKAIPCKRIGLTVIGLEVPHAHVHLIPLHTMEDARFIKKEKLTSEELQQVANAIKAEL
ncbi:histidine triad (HIT) family protein [Flaviramulus basaltis]|uniref:Histidine triad (HIT) family protein n=2 Tax=Flaviramulus basaltis TaxID=369401 RepID=A0A1K2IB51_9FLAO|nr:histidine triad (HIT) family protein [Flaviramulus basaltis]